MFKFPRSRTAAPLDKLLAPNVEVTDISTTEIQDNIANQNRELEFFTFSTAPPAPAPIEQPATENEEVVEIHDDEVNNEEEIQEPPQQPQHAPQIPPGPPPGPPSVPARSQPPPKTSNNQQPYRATCNTCNKDLSSRSVQVHARKMHGLKGSVSTLSTPIPTPDAEPQPSEAELHPPTSSN